MSKIIIHEVGPRDGLQVEKQIVPFDLKVKWIEKLIDSGVDIIQVGSFVHPEKVPQMADTDRLFAYFMQPEKKTNSVILSGLVLNEKGLERGMACGVELFCMGASASDTYSRKNTGMSSGEATERIIAIAKRAMEAKKKVQVSVQSAFGCSYEGAIPEERVLDMVKRYLNAGIRNISLADTAGYAFPQQVERLFSKAMSLDTQAEFACHFHETYGLGLANCYTAMQVGVKYFESSFGGLGGSPFAAVTSGNVCTEDLVHLLQRMGLRTEIKLSPIIEVTKDASQFFNRQLPGFVWRLGVAP
ncbi:MAG: hydroxymethylglutaryl-CoA lyase [Bacteroidota bacterium]